MAEFQEIKAAARERTGTAAARALRREGRVPAIIYGDKKQPELVSLDNAELWRYVRTGHFLSTVYTLDVNGQKTRVIPRDLQVDPVRDHPTHVDFLRLGEGARIAVEVAVTFLNEEESPGLKRGGLLNVVRYTIELLCPAESIPEAIEADVAGLDIGDSIHISDIKLPADVELTITDRDFTVATIAGRMAEIVEEEVEEEGLEGEKVEGGEGAEEEAEDEGEASED